MFVMDVIAVISTRKTRAEFAQKWKFNELKNIKLFYAAVVCI